MPSKPFATVVFITLLLLGGGCASRTASESPAAGLLTSLQATTAGDSVHFLLQVTNPGTEAVVLEFNAEPIVQFVVRRDALPLWDSAPESALAEEVTTDVLEPGDTRSFHASWSVPIGLRGTLTVTGALRDRRSPLVQSTRFMIQ